MRKIVSILLSVLLVFSFSFAFAETNLSDMSYDDLIALQKELTKEIMSRPEWKEVKIPAGEWVVGQDIPAGIYSIVIPKGGSAVIHLWGAAIDDYDTNGGMRLSDYRHEGEDIGKIELFDGNILELGDTVILTPPISLGF